MSVADGLDTLTIDTIEEAALGMGAAVRQQVAQGLIRLGSGQVSPEVLCPECGQAMRYKGLKRRYVRNRSGEIQLITMVVIRSAILNGSFDAQCSAA